MRRLRRLVALQLVGSGGRVLLPLLVVVVGGAAGLLATSLRGTAPQIAESPAAPWWVALATTASLLTTVGWPLVAVTVFWHHLESASLGSERCGRLGVTRRHSYLVSALTGCLLAAGYSALALLAAVLAAVLTAVLGAPGVGLPTAATQLSGIGAPGGEAAAAEVVALTPAVGTLLLASACLGLLTGTVWRRWRSLGLLAGGAAVMLLVAAGAAATTDAAWPAGLPAVAGGAGAAVGVGAAGFLLVERPGRRASYRPVQVPQEVATTGNGPRSGAGPEPTDD